LATDDGRLPLSRPVRLTICLTLAESNGPLHIVVKVTRSTLVVLREMIYRSHPKPRFLYCCSMRTVIHRYAYYRQQHEAKKQQFVHILVRIRQNNVCVNYPNSKAKREITALSSILCFGLIFSFFAVLT
jgi:hypothetical protein